MYKKAILKKDLGKLKEGTVLHYTSGVFAHKGHTFMPEDVFGDEVHFKLVETNLNGIISESCDDEVTPGSIFDIFTKPQIAGMVTG